MHEMKLQSAYYDAILNGEKRIEIRLNDEKRQLVKTGDVITFRRANNLEEFFDVIVIDLLYYPTFQELLDDLSVEQISPSGINKEELRKMLSQFYTVEEETKYGVVGLKFELRDANGKI